MPLFNNESIELIRIHMKEYEHCHDRFVKISEKIPQYTPKQISNHWRNYLDSRLCRDPLTNDEKNFIIIWVQNNRKSNVIHWKYAIYDLEEKFGNHHSENKIKNFWNSNMRKLNRNESATADAATKLHLNDFWDSKMKRPLGKVRTKVQKQKGSSLNRNGLAKPKQKVALSHHVDSQFVMESGNSKMNSPLEEKVGPQLVMESGNSPLGEKVQEQKVASSHHVGPQLVQEQKVAPHSHHVHPQLVTESGNSKVSSPLGEKLQEQNIAVSSQLVVTSSNSMISHSGAMNIMEPNIILLGPICKLPCNV